MTDEQLADIIIGRLNKLIEDPNVRKDIQNLIEARVPASWETVKKTIVQVHEDDAGKDVFGFLGLLNGLVGEISGGLYNGYGHICAVYDKDDNLLSFRRTGTEKWT